MVWIYFSDTVFASYLLVVWFCIYTHAQLRILKFQDSAYQKAEVCALWMLSWYFTLFSEKDQTIFKVNYLKFNISLSALWTTKPRDFYHPNHLSTGCVLESFNSWSAPSGSYGEQGCWLTLLLARWITLAKLSQCVWTATPRAQVNQELKL